MVLIYPKDNAQRGALQAGVSVAFGFGGGEDFVEGGVFASVLYETVFQTFA